MKNCPFAFNIINFSMSIINNDLELDEQPDESLHELMSVRRAPSSDTVVYLKIRCSNFVNK